MPRWSPHLSPDTDSSGGGEEPLAAPTPAYPPGITVVTMASGLPRALDGQGLILLHVSYDSGAVIHAHTDPGAATFSVQSGTIDLRIDAGTAELRRAGQPDSETLGEGDSAVMQVGDSVFYDAGTAHTTSNGGTELATIIVAAIFAPDRPILQPVHGEASGTSSA